MASQFSLIMTMFNEEGNMGALLGDIATQTLVPDEVVLVDGGSTDGTVEAIESQREALAAVGCELRVEVVPGANVPHGRNLAIAAAKHECICVTDAGCRIEPQWCERITAPIREGRADFVGGFFRPAHRNRFQKVLGALTVADSPPPGFLPSSRSIAFTKTIWTQVGEYPEWLRWGEDTLFNELCIEAGARYVIVPDAIVRWEVRPTLRAAMRQFNRYACGDGLRRHFSRSHVANLGSIVASLALGIALHPLWLLLFPVYVLLLTIRAMRKLDAADFPLAYATAFLIRLARAAGFLEGLVTTTKQQESGGRA